MRKFFFILLGFFIGLWILEIILGTYVITKIAEYTWFHDRTKAIIFMVIVVIFLLFHVLWAYSFISCGLAYTLHIKVNDSIIFISLCTMFFAIFWMIFFLIEKQVFISDSTQIIMISTLIVNIFIFMIMKIIILKNYGHFYRLFVNHILTMSTKKGNSK